MTSSGKRPSPLSPAQVRKIVLEAIESESYKETTHASLDHPERLISINDVLHGLEQSWTACNPEEFSDWHWQWKYRIATTDLDDEALVVIVAIDTRNKSFEVITRFHDRP